MFCTNCGKQLPDGTVLCPGCNADLSSVAEMFAPVSTAEVAAEVTSQAVPELNADIASVTEVLTETTTPAEEEIPAEEPVTEDPAEACQSAPQSDETAHQTQTPEQDFAPPAASPFVPEYTEKPKKSKKKIFLSILTHTFAVIVSILLCAMLIGASFYTVFRITFSENSLERLVESVFAAELDVTDLVSEQQKQELGIDDDSVSLVDIIYENIDQSRLKFSFTRSELSELLDSLDIADLISERVSESIAQIKSGDDASITVFDPDGVVELLKEHKSEVKKILGYSLTSDDYSNIKKVLKEKQEENDSFGKIEISSVAPGAVADAVGILFSNWILVAVWFLCALVAALVFLIRYSVTGGLRYCGTTAIVAGGIVTLCSLAMLIDFISPLVGGGIGKLIARAISVVGVNTLIVGGSVLGAGILFILTAYLIKLICRKRSEKKEKNNQTNAFA